MLGVAEKPFPLAVVVLLGTGHGFAAAHVRVFTRRDPVSAFGSTALPNSRSEPIVGVFLLATRRSTMLVIVVLSNKGLSQYHIR